MLYMNKRGIPGIPYFGINQNEIVENIKSADIVNSIEYSSLYDLVQNEKSINKVVVVEYDNQKWLTYLRDIRFNYRNSICFLPFYTYEVKELDLKYTSDFAGHILSLDEGRKIGVRYNYCLRQKKIDKESNSLVLYDLEKQEKYSVSFREYFSKNIFDIDKLYQFFIDYSRNYEDSLLYKHTEGYTIIARNVEGLHNIERDMRSELGLDDYIPSDTNLFYRDVRNLSEKEYISKIGLDMCNKSYWERRYDFESYLYCILHSDAVPNNDFSLEWKKLGKNKEFIKYGNKGIKLIFKSYWLPNCEKYNKKSWSRI